MKDDTPKTEVLFGDKTDWQAKDCFVRGCDNLSPHAAYTLKKGSKERFVSIRCCEKPECMTEARELISKMLSKKVISYST